MTDKMYTIGQIAKLTGYSRSTLNRWHNNGTFKANHISSGNHKKYYTETQLYDLLNRAKPNKIKRHIIGYARVSSNHQKNDLTHQVETLESYLTAQGQPFMIIRDIGSGMNFNKKGFVKLLNLIETNQVEKIVVTYRDRLMRFGFDLIKQICALHKTEIEIINQTSDTSDTQELTQDLVEIITVFSAHLYGKRSHQQKDLIKIVKGGET